MVNKNALDFTYTQCKLQRGSTFQTAWIPSTFAKKNLYLNITGQNGWKVISTGGTLPAEYVYAHERDYAKAFPSLK